MDKKFLFDRNLLALSRNNPRLCSRLSAASTRENTYRFLESRSGQTIPALVLDSGSARPLHSTVDPKREAERLVSTARDEGFLVFLGLGGGFAPLAALGKGSQVLVVDYGCDGVAELLCSRDYAALFGDSRFCFLVDPDPREVEECITLRYKPVLHGGIRAIPLIPRTEGDGSFSGALDGIRRAIEASSRDYSVQAWFGTRWFSNILRNLPLAEKSWYSLPPIRRAAVTAAGPSLETQLPRIAGERDGVFLIASDTSLPVLLGAGIEPDGVLSIDCQHISYQHFFSLPEKTFLFADLASPPVVTARSNRTVFLAGGHPLARYIQSVWRPFPSLDTSGANVAGAAFSLAESMGASEIVLYGADFSYPMGKTYARGTYIYPFFEKKQNRFCPLESGHSAFLYRSSSLEKRRRGDGSWYYETESLKFYRAMLERKALLSSGGSGCFRLVPRPPPSGAAFRLLCPGNSRGGAAEFFAAYRSRLQALSSFCEAEDESRNVVTTILPAAAAFRRLEPSISLDDLFEKTRDWCRKELDRVINSGSRLCRT